MKITILLAFICLSLTSCAGSPLHIATMSPEKLKTANSWTLCNAYAITDSEDVRIELQRRGEMSLNDWGGIIMNKIHIGMSELALVCSWGYPNIWGSVNKSVGSWGVHKQYVYRSCRYCKGQYVYIENGKITSWSN